MLPMGWPTARSPPWWGVSAPTVLAWREELIKRGVRRIGEVAAGRGRKPSIPQETVEKVVELTLHHRPEGATHWSVRSMAAQVGTSPASVQRILAKVRRGRVTLQQASTQTETLQLVTADVSQVTGSDWKARNPIRSLRTGLPASRRPGRCRSSAGKAICAWSRARLAPRQ